MNQVIKEALDQYGKENVPTGGFLRAVLANDFMEAVARADDYNLLDLHEIACYIYNNIPYNCHGSYEIVEAWIAKKREKRGDENDA